MQNFEILNSKMEFIGKALSVKCDEISLPDNNTTTRETVLRGNASAIIPIDRDGNIIFVKQYRHSILAETLEIPAGMIDDGEDPMQAALRELEEETSFIANSIKHIITIYPAIGFCNEQIFIYVASDLQQGSFNFDSDEFISIEKYTLQQSLALIFDGTIKDAKTISAILAYSHTIK